MSSPGDTIQVLHVDDEPDFAEMAAEFITRQNDRIAVETAEGAGEGLDRILAGQFDCVVSDYDMPGQTGIEFLDAVREHYPELPFILYTGKGSEEIASDAISAGVSDYLQKESGSGHYTVLANRIRNAVDQYRSRQAVQETERKLSQLAERTDDILFIFNGDWSELLFINSAYEELWGGSIDELKKDPTSFLELIHPEDRENARASMEQVLNGDSAQLEYRVVRPDGEIRWVRGDTKPIHDRNGNRVRIVGQVRDFTELKERELLLESIIDNLPGYVYRHEYDSEYALEFVKGDAESITGYTATELEEEIINAEEVIHPDDREDLWANHIEGLEATGEFDSTYRIITKDGDVRWIQDQGQLNEDPVTGEDVIDGFITDISDKIQQGRELKKQQTFIDESLDAIQDIFFVINEEGSLIRWNERISAITGYTDEEIDELNVTEFFAEDHRDRVIESVEEVMQTGSSDVQADLLTAEGERRPFEFRGTRLSDSFRGHTVAVGIGRDMSELVQRQQEMRELYRRHELALGATNTGIWEWNMETDEVVWSEEVEELLGLERGSFVGTFEAYTNYLHPDSVAQIEQASQRAIDEDGTFDEEFRMLREDGEVIWVHGQGQIFTEDGPKRMLGTVTEITERKTREQELERYGRIVEHLDDIATIIDSDGTITYVSPSVQRVLGYEPEELIGENGFAYQPESTAKGVANAIEYVSEHPSESRTVQTEFRRADGSFCWVESTLRNRLEDDVIDGFLVSSRVVTERIQRQQRLEAQNERLDEFASVVSHDIRNPLRVAEGNLELLKEDFDSEHIESIEQALNRMDTLIEDLLILAREGKRVSDTESVNIEKIAEQSWANVETADAALQTRTDRTIKADRSRLAQLLENLIRNAVEHGGEAVKVTVGELDDGFYLEDTGPGIPEGDRDEVFEAGYSTVEEGTGFGLSIAKQVADAHGWNIEVTESADGGARFEVTSVEAE